VSAPEYLIDASAYWRIDRGAVLTAAWRDHLERGLTWICPPTEMETCRRASKVQHSVHPREFTGTYVQVEPHHRAGAVAREIQPDLTDSGQAAGVHPIDLLIATALGYGFTVLTDDGDYARQIATRPRTRWTPAGPSSARTWQASATGSPAPE
jgi:predicted nucleic acid-binding protein